MSFHPELAALNMSVEKRSLVLVVSVIYLGTAVEKRTLTLFFFSLRGEVRDSSGTILPSMSHKVVYNFHRLLFPLALLRPHFPCQGFGLI